MNAISLSNHLPYRAIHKPRITHTSATCIDLFITNRPNLVLDIKVSPNFCSDHCPVSVDINIKTSKEHSYKRTIRKYDQADYNHTDYPTYQCLNHLQVLQEYSNPI
jgi:hypothetical protein